MQRHIKAGSYKVVDGTVGFNDLVASLGSSLAHIDGCHRDGIAEARCRVVEYLNLIDRLGIQVLILCYKIIGQAIFSAVFDRKGAAASNHDPGVGDRHFYGLDRREDRPQLTHFEAAAPSSPKRILADHLREASAHQSCGFQLCCFPTAANYDSSLFWRLFEMREDNIKTFNPKMNPVR